MNRALLTHWKKLASVLLVLAILVPLAVRTPVLAADQSLVVQALQVLEDNYVDPVDAVKALNAAIAGVRTQLSSSGVTAQLSDIPAGVQDAEAKRQFADRFATAASMAGATVPPTQLAYAAIRGMTESFKDSHTGFLTPEQISELRQRQRGQAGFTGVGIILAPRDGKFFVLMLIPGGPAEAAGVKEFDRILKVNDVSTAGMSVDQVSGMIRGPAGTTVTLTLQRPGVTDPLVLTITRAPISVPSIFRAELLEGGVGYIRLYQFVDRTGRDFRSAVTQLQAQGMRALVLDVRGNSGGFLMELASVLNALLPAGLPVYTEMRKGGSVRVVRTVGPSLLPASMPLVLLVDENSASASELLAAAIKENRRGQLIGEKTAGAVEASILIDLSDGSALSVTTFRLATGKGVRLEGVGVEPDTVATLTTADFESGQDRPLGTAIRVARQILALLPVR